MAERKLIVDPSQIDFEHVIADVEQIRRYNRQRHEMEQITAIVFEDAERFLCVGYKDVGDDEFWVRGHMPGMPLMPGVIMLEAVAQMASFYVQKNDLLKAEIVGLGGFEDVRFRGVVRPGDRLVLACQLTRVRPRAMIICRFQGIVGGAVVVEGVLKGIPLPVDALKAAHEPPTAD